MAGAPLSVVQRLRRAGSDLQFRAPVGVRRSGRTLLWNGVKTRPELGL